MSENERNEPAVSGEKTFMGHPPALFVLFFSELWERFSFYGMRALLVLYMTKRLLYADADAYGVYAAYGALVYALPVLGGMLADRLLGYRRAIILGGSLMAIGHFVMAFEPAFYEALALIALGNGFFKPNISSLVGKLYAQKDPRRDSGFTIFYMGINIGAFLAPLACGYIGEEYGWHYGFGLAGIGMVVGLVGFVLGKSFLMGYGEPPDPQRLRAPVLPGISGSSSVLVACVVAVPLISLTLQYNSVVSYVLYGGGFVILGYLLTVAFKSDRVAGQRLGVVIILIFFHTVFWACFEQAGSSLTLFTDRNVDRTVFGTEIKTSLFQAVNPLFIVIFAPLFSMLWPFLERRGLNPSIPMKFSLGLVQLAFGFCLLVVGAQFAGPDGMTAVTWILLAYLLQTTGELCLSPVGLSAVTKLSPPQIVGTVMGAWMLSVAFAHNVAGFIAGLTETGDGGGEAIVTPAETLGVYAGVFQQIFIGALITAVVLAVLTPVVKRMTHGVK